MFGSDILVVPKL